MPHLYVKIFLTHMKERVALLYMSQSDQEDQEQVAEEPLRRGKEKESERGETLFGDHGSDYKDIA